MRKTYIDDEETLFYRELCDQSFYHFIKLCGGPVYQGGIITKYIHKPLCQFYERDELKRKAAGMPRDWLKSTCYTKWKTIYDYLKNQEARQLIASENERIAMNFNIWIQRQILNNEALRNLYWDKLHMVDSTWTRKVRWSGTVTELPREGIYSEPAIQAIGVGGAAQSGHYTHIKIDDLVGQDAMESITIMEKVFRWFDNVNELLVEPEWDDPNASEISIVGTHWSPGDYFTYVQEKYPEYQWKMVPARKDTELEDKKNFQWIQNPSVDDGESNWPERFSTKYYVDMASNPERQMIYWAQHQNNPNKAAGLTKMERDWFRFFRFEERDKGTYVVCLDKDEDQVEPDAFRLAEINLIGMIDPGGFRETKVLKKGSRNAVLIGGQPRTSYKKFVVYTHADRFKSPANFHDIIFDAHEKWQPRVWRCDHAGQQDFIYKDILQERKERGIPLYIYPLDTLTSLDAKDKVIQSLISPVFNGEIYLHESMKELLEEAVSYPGGLTRDLIDMLGRLYQEYWTRTAQEDVDKKMKQKHADYMMRRGQSRTGY